MRIEIWILLATAFFVYDTYHEGKYLKMLMSYKKYYTMMFYAVVGIGIVLLMKRNPSNCKQLLSNANNLVKYMPIDKSSMALFSPIFDLTNNSSNENFGIGNFGIGNFGNNGNNSQTQTQDLNRATSTSNKRSVSETKKKYVAANQEWKCGHCNNQLDHTYEIDHKVRLEYGGGNDVDNLVALCRNCHGKKTASENM
jgi:5-methylcytosine-specific restriction endonuclease McrA